MTEFHRYFIAGGAGFIGSHFTDRLLRESTVAAVTIYDNFSSGREWHYQHHLADPRFHVIRGDVKRSEERRVGKEGRSRGWPDQRMKKKVHIVARYIQRNQ